MFIYRKISLAITLPALLALATANLRAADPAPSPLAVTAVADPAKLSPGQTSTITVTIKNTSDAPQTIQIPSMWWATSSNPDVSFPKWPARGGIGPAMVFTPKTIDPGQAYTHTWQATVAAGAAPGELTFKISIPLQRGGPSVSSDPVTLTIQAK